MFHFIYDGHSAMCSDHMHTISQNQRPTSVSEPALMTVYYCSQHEHSVSITYYLLTESEVITGKSQTEALMY